MKAILLISLLFTSLTFQVTASDEKEIVSEGRERIRMGTVPVKRYINDTSGKKPLMFFKDVKTIREAAERLCDHIADTEENVYSTKAVVEKKFFTETSGVYHAYCEVQSLVKN